MDIQEVTIDTEKKKTKKVSPRIINASQKWLQEKGVDLEDLSEPQREVVFHFIKQKRGLFWGILISLPCAILCIIGITLFTRVIKGSDELFIPKQYAVENEEGEKIYQEVPGPLKESINLYGKMCLLFGTLFAGGLYTIASGIGTSIGAFYSVKRKEKTISAFLPISSE